MSIPALAIMCPNLTRVDVHKGCVFFSYNTPIAFKDNEGNLFICENVWSRTTGKHLNMINRDQPRIPHDQFNILLDEYFSGE